MKYIKSFVMIFSLLLILFGASVISAEAQRRVYRRPVIVYQPYWDTWGYDPYYYDPYYREREQKYYLERSVRGNRNELEKHRQKYYADGVLSEKERRELADDEKDYNDSLRRLNQFRRNY